MLGCFYDIIHVFFFLFSFNSGMYMVEKYHEALTALFFKIFTPIKQLS